MSLESFPEKIMQMSDTFTNDVLTDKDLPLRDDIRLLGRLLGDTVREQEGERIFDVIERIRQASHLDPTESKHRQGSRAANARRTRFHA